MAAPSEWQSPEHALAYLRRADTIPHRTDGEETLLAELPVNCRRVLDLGSGDGRLMALTLLARPGRPIQPPAGASFAPPGLLTSAIFTPTTCVVG